LTLLVGSTPHDSGLCVEAAKLETNAAGCEQLRVGMYGEG
jgi:hypothetical protein